ncbi:Meiotic Sister-Chromatid recombination aldehyde dehydrogenase [Stygiomarasmius scandens]|uniref:Meiotic Sister-Chromatid recombination aldehyde dehydrogenase n=1 Tax=Marasmiellus scandens TaxID=2682957 RepID=A0ABR1J8K5_9AGAR
MSLTLDKVVYFFLHPVKSLSSDNTDGEGIDPFYVLSAFIALGIWLVIEREKRARNSPVPFGFIIPKEADPKWIGYKIKDPCLESHLEDQQLMPPALPGRRYITGYDPGSGYHLTTALADSEEEIAAMIAKAEQAQRTWRKTTFTQRRRVIRSLKKWLVDNQELCARVACRDTGKTLIDAALGEILTTCSKMEWLIEHGERYLRPETRSNNLILCYKDSKVHYDPLGVVTAIVSWNYPLHNAWSPILAGIFAGNAVVLKCSENVIWSTTWFISIIKNCLEALGHDPELVQLCHCWPEQANALIKSPKIKHITFIGSETVGRKVAVAATDNLTPVTLELGGKDPAVILPDTELDRWISLWMRGVYQNAGQNCIGIERLIVHTSQFDDLYDLIKERVEKLRCGSVMSTSDQGYLSPVDVGAMISNNRFESLEYLIREAEEDGAKILGGGRYEHVYLDQGYYFKPTIVGLTNHSASIAKHELFAPIALLIPYESIEEAVEIANGTRYALGASVFGPDQDLCVKVAKQLECGMVSVNDFAVFYLK